MKSGDQIVTGRYIVDLVIFSLWCIGIAYDILFQVQKPFTLYI